MARGRYGGSPTKTMFLQECQGDSAGNLKLSEGRQAIVACMLWKWWDRRNKLNAGEIVCSSQILCMGVNAVC